MSELLINVMPAETRVALVEQGTLKELMLERNRSRSHVGDIFQGKVLRVMPGMEAAFVDIGLERAGFIHASDISELDAQGLEVRREQPARIGELLREGQFLTVQVIKDAIAGKGARLSNHLALAARHLVLLPRSLHVGVSQKIVDHHERERLETLLKESLTESDWEEPRGLIVRTVAEGATQGEFLEDLGHLHRLWVKLKERLRRPNEVRCVYSEEPIFVRSMRDLFGPKVSRILVDDVGAFDKLSAFLKDYIPEARPLLELTAKEPPLFELCEANGVSIEQQIESALEKKVRLPNGGDLVIEQTESMVTIDVNTGSFIGARDQDSTILETNLEAAAAIALHLRLRNLGGIIVIDFIDMHCEEHRSQVRKALIDALAKDGARTVVGEFSQFGLLEMTRKRVRESLQRVLRVPCEDCSGDGHVASIDTVVSIIHRRLLVLSSRGDIFRVKASHAVIDALREESRIIEQSIDGRLEFLECTEYARSQFDIEITSKRLGGS
jgi:ribonuclease G